MRLLLAILVLVGVARGCTTDAECGTAEQAGLCLAGVCQCGVGFVGDTGVDPSLCNSLCVPPPVPDSVAFLGEPTVAMSASAGELVLEVTLDANSKQVPTTVAFQHPSTNVECAMLPALLGAGKWTQGVSNGAGECDQTMRYAAPFAAEVGQPCWEALPDTTENGANFQIGFKNFKTRVEVIQSGLAPFGQAAARSGEQLALRETSIARLFRRNYTISIADSFVPQSAPFTVTADGLVRYRLVEINYDIANDQIIVTVETQTASEVFLRNSAINQAGSTGLSAIVTPAAEGACEASSPAGFCNQFHTMAFGDDPCQVAGAELHLDVEMICADGASDPSTCGFTGLPAGNVYTLTNLLIDYDACPVVVEYGIDGAASFLRLHEDTPRTTALTGAASMEATYYGRCSVVPSAGGVFQSLELTALSVVRVEQAGNVNLGDQLGSGFVAMVSPLTSTDPNNAIWDFDLTVDPAFFAVTETYFLEATVSVVFANTGPITARLQIPIMSELRMRQSERGLGKMRMLVAREGEEEPEADEEGVYSPTFQLAAVETEEEAGAEQAAVDVGLIAGVVAGVAACAVAGIVLAVVLVRRRKKKDEAEGGLGQMQLDSSSTTSEDLSV